MACFWLNQNVTAVEIPSTCEISNITFYKIEITVGEIKWTVLHRYSEFYELHNLLVADHGLSKDIIPSKKVIRNKCPVFIESRRQALESYLQKVLNYLKRTMPRVFLEFLNFQLYDIFFLLQNLAIKFYLDGVTILCTTNKYTLTPLELHAISECFKTALPVAENSDNRFDFTHVVDFCSQLKSLVVNGSFSPFLDSNVIPNNLEFEFTSFKVLTSIELNEVSLGKIYSVGNLRQCLLELAVHKTSMTKICEILQCDVLHKSELRDQQAWTNLTTMDLSNNNLTEIDQSIRLAPNLKILILNANKISSISDLSFLSKLTSISLANNLISMCNQLHTKFGNILYLNLSQNSLTTTKGFEKLYSLEGLDLSCNRINDINEIIAIGGLPCLENLVLTGNNLATSVDYRIRVLELFGDRAKEICLDNEKPSQPELDKVSVLRALRIVKEGKTPNLIEKHII